MTHHRICQQHERQTRKYHAAVAADKQDSCRRTRQKQNTTKNAGLNCSELNCRSHSLSLTNFTPPGALSASLKGTNISYFGTVSSVFKWVIWRCLHIPWPLLQLHYYTYVVCVMFKGSVNILKWISNHAINMNTLIGFHPLSWICIHVAQCNEKC